MFSSNKQSRFASIVLDGPPTTEHLTLSLYILKATHEEASQRPLKVAMSAQKALHGSEAEMRDLLGGMEEKSISRREAIDFTGKKNDFYVSGHPNI